MSEQREIIQADPEYFIPFATLGGAGRVRGTGDVEDAEIAASRDLPKYGDLGNSICLLRSEATVEARAPASTDVQR